MCSGMRTHAQRCDVCAAFGNRQRSRESYVRISRPHRHCVVQRASYVYEWADQLNHRPKPVLSSGVSTYPASDFRCTHAWTASCSELAG